MFDETLSVLTEQIEDLPLRPADQTPEIGEQCKRAALIYAGMGARLCRYITLRMGAVLATTPHAVPPARTPSCRCYRMACRVRPETQR